MVRRLKPLSAADEGLGGDAVARELERLGAELAASGAAQVGDSFTDIPEADALLKRDPNAFLLGVLFTQGIPAERAWAAPYLLAERLGHLDPSRLSCEKTRVRDAIADPPALHRFVGTLPTWVSSAGGRIATEYAGDASRMWPEGASAREVAERLLEFDGIGQKKAAMTVELLERHFGVELQGLWDSTVARDVHVRRVFLRSGLIDVDTEEAMREAAARACPERPGRLDLPAWRIGRAWCRPTAPRCDACAIGSLCARRVWITVDGVGARTS